MNVRRGLLLVVAALSVGACRKQAPPKPPAVERGSDVIPIRATKVSKAQLAAQPTAASAAPATDDVDPLTRRLCHALHALPAERKGACCKGEGTPSSTVGACRATLGRALASKRVTVDEADIAACEAALRAAYAGCAWVGPWPPATPPACDGIIRGATADGQPCESSLECAGTLRCHGVGPGSEGRCGPPKAAGANCRTGVDPLAAYTRHDTVDRRRPECAGYCRRFKCVPAVGKDKRCASNVQCAAGLHCDGQRCRPGVAIPVGGRCADTGCARGSRCYRGRCIVPRATGEACRTDFECRAACLQKEPESPGTCGPRCRPKLAVDR